MGYRLNCLDEPVFMTVSKPLLTDLGIHHRLESCVTYLRQYLYIISIMSTYSGSLFPRSLTFYFKPSPNYLVPYLYVIAIMYPRSRSEPLEAATAAGSGEFRKNMGLEYMITLKAPGCDFSMKIYTS